MCVCIDNARMLFGVNSAKELYVVVIIDYGGENGSGQFSNGDWRWQGRILDERGLSWLNGEVTRSATFALQRLLSLTSVRLGQKLPAEKQGA
ncbi:hypothetical protein TWF696_009115 [Orbilia brochopaga]|uniref:MHC class I antigen n=1 Tax=Orbilia brochopaga TaxID=3140254 RepID=A0AAV9UFS9_9PEZI